MKYVLQYQMMKGVMEATMAIPEEAEQSIEQQVTADEQSKLLSVTNVERIFQVGSSPLHVLKGIQLELKPRQLVMLRGRSGSGKTTLLNCLGGLDTPNKGEIWFNGQ